MNLELLREILQSNKIESRPIKHRLVVELSLTQVEMNQLAREEFEAFTKLDPLY